MSLKTIREVIRKESVRQLSDNVPPAVYEHFINEFVDQWSFICLESFREIEELLEKLLNDLCTDHFGRFLSSGLLRKVRFSHPACVRSLFILGKLRRKLSKELRRIQKRTSGSFAKWNVVGHLH